jgi:uncharacterized repeat protein (TIGR01451 family)
VTVVLSNCAGATYDTAVTDALGNYRLTVPFGTAPGAPLCATESTPTGLVPTNASVGSTQLPSGSAVTTGGTAYTYSRAPLVRIAFTWNGSGHSALDFGLVGLNTFAASEAKNGLPGTTVTYAHTFVAATGGSVSFTIPTVVDTPAISGWSGRIYADTGCTGTLQSGATVLYPPSLATTVTAGQIVCIVMQEFIPAGALSGYNDKSTVQASFAFSNSSPGLTASYAVNDATTVSLGALDLKKEVSNVTQSGAFGLNNQARSGETLEYRITYTNNGTTPIRNLVLSDSTPSFTSFVGSLTGTTPATLTACVKNTPANPLPAAAVNCAAVQAAGGSGTLNWNLTGSLNPGDSGTVLFRVKVN